MTPTLSMLIFGLALPLGLVLLNWALPTRSRIGFALRTLAIAILLLAMALRLMWLFPPWWTPYAALGLLIVTSVGRLGRGGAGGGRAFSVRPRPCRRHLAAPARPGSADGTAHRHRSRRAPA